MNAAPQITVTIVDGRAHAVVVGCLGYILAEDSYNPRDRAEMRRAARWLQVPIAELRDKMFTAQIRAAA
jgi:hypothetical protein